MKLPLLPLGNCTKTQLFSLLEFFFKCTQDLLVLLWVYLDFYLLYTPFSLTIRLVPFWRANVYWAPTVCKASLGEWMATIGKGCSTALDGSAWVRKLQEKLSQVKRPKKSWSEFFYVSDLHKAVKAWGHFYLCLGIRTQKVLKCTVISDIR